MNPTKAIDRMYYAIVLNELRMMNETRLYDSITYNSLLYLDLISYTENCTVSLLADALHVAKSSVTLKVNELIKQGMVEKTQSEKDRRIFYLTLRPEILEEFQKLDRASNYAVQQIQKQYTAEEIKVCCEMLDTFSSHYSQYAEIAAKKGENDDKRKRN